MLQAKRLNFERINTDWALEEKNKRFCFRFQTKIQVKVVSLKGDVQN